MEMKVLVFMFIGLVVVPVLFCVLVLTPFYLSLWMALYFLYQPKEAGGVNPFADSMLDVSTVWEQYDRVASHWAQAESADFMSFTLPLFGPPIFGVMITLLAGWLAYRHVRGFFNVDSL